MAASAAECNGSNFSAVKALLRRISRIDLSGELRQVKSFMHALGTYLYAIKSIWVARKFARFPIDSSRRNAVFTASGCLEGLIAKALEA
jgi:hypothetical protein